MRHRVTTGHQSAHRRQRLGMAGLGTLVAILAMSPQSLAHRAAHRPMFVSVNGPSDYLNYDGDNANLSRNTRDWPLTLIFYRNAAVNKVGDALAARGYKNFGSPAYEPYHSGSGAHTRYDTSKGRKTDCDSHNNDYHYRFYAPGNTDRFYDLKYGYVVVASTHIDHNECTSGPKRYGRSEEVEQRIANDAEAIGWSVRRNHSALLNREPLRRDRNDPGHVWENNGIATDVRVP